MFISLILFAFIGLAQCSDISPDVLCKIAFNSNSMIKKRMPEEKVSNYFHCQDTRNCTFDMVVTKRLALLNWDNSPNLTRQRVACDSKHPELTETFSFATAAGLSHKCIVSPGHAGWLSLRPQYIQIPGMVETCCNGQKVKLINKTSFPLVDDNNHPTGVIECKSKAVSNTKLV